MNIPTVRTEDELVHSFTVKQGEVIKAPEFRNLLYKDREDLDPMAGFWVNPRLGTRSWDQMITSTFLENPGLINKKIRRGYMRDMQDYKLSIDAEREFVVIHTFRNCDYPKEQIFEEKPSNYPLTVIAKMLSPDGEWDSFGIEIWFNMESREAKNIVPAVISCGFMSVTYKRVL